MTQFRSNLCRAHDPGCRFEMHPMRWVFDALWMNLSLASHWTRFLGLAMISLTRNIIYNRGVAPWYAVRNFFAAACVEWADDDVWRAVRNVTDRRLVRIFPHMEQLLVVWSSAVRFAFLETDTFMLEAQGNCLSLYTHTRLKQLPTSFHLSDGRHNYLEVPLQGICLLFHIWGSTSESIWMSALLRYDAGEDKVLNSWS